jgi:uncharacterized protein YdcH (DUF465 family)
MEEILKQILARLDSMDSRFDSMDGRFNSLEGRFSSLENKMETGFAEVREDIRKLGDQLAEGFDLVLQTHDRHHEELDDRVKKIENTFNSWTTTQ